MVLQGTSIFYVGTGKMQSEEPLRISNAMQVNSVLMGKKRGCYTRRQPGRLSFDQKKKKKKGGGHL